MLIEFLHNKIYFGSYDYVPEDTDKQVYLTIDDTLPYNNFHHDFGPLSVAHVYRFAVILHDILGRPENQNKELVFYSYTDPRSRANGLCLLACYMILIQSWQPHQVLAPMAQSVPVMPFRDAGYSIADFIVTVQDVVYAIWKAKKQNLIELRRFDLEEYEHYELVENGDLNAIGEHFVAFASPVSAKESNKSVLRYFKKHDVRMVVRLNSHLYDKKIFEDVNIKHVDMIFEDGSCPPMSFVKGFIGLAEGVIREGGKVAVHCRAGLGRTGCLIGAHLIYSYGFTATEAIAYMRFLRPGMVVGPQQHWLYQHQNEFRDWRHTMKVGTLGDTSLSGYSPLVELAAAETSSSNLAVPRTPERNILTPQNPSVSNSCLPQPTPGQPRKTPSPIRVSSAASVSSAARARRPMFEVTNSDDESSGREDEADVIVSHVRRSTVSQQVGKRTVSARTLSRGHAREQSSVLVLPRRRNITEIATPSQQLSLAKQLRIVSNPSPRKRSQEGRDRVGSENRPESRVSDSCANASRLETCDRSVNDSRAACEGHAVREDTLESLSLEKCSDVRV